MICQRLIVGLILLGWELTCSTIFWDLTMFSVYFYFVEQIIAISWLKYIFVGLVQKFIKFSGVLDQPWRHILLGLFRNSKNYQGFWTNHDGIQGSWLNNLSSLEVQKVTRGFGPTMMAYKASQTFGCWDNFSVQYFAWQISKTQVFFLCRFTPNKIQTCVEL